MDAATHGQQIALITGAEQGLGREIARQLAARGIGVVVTARDSSLAQAVVAELTDGGGTAWALQLDVTSDCSVNSAAAVVRATPGRLNILINNAGICLDDPGGPLEANFTIILKTLETNFLGAWRVCKAFVPIIRESGSGRIVNISSAMGQLETMGVDSPAYRVSKTALNALTGMLAADLAGAKILVNAVDPGWIRTDMGGPGAPRSVEEGARTPVWLATLPEGSPSGGFYFERRLIPW
jgi:NAD(P)-dependent dehydrogenase (short-subunit alcohol dehydrogenase family)